MINTPRQYKYFNGVVSGKSQERCRGVPALTAPTPLVTWDCQSVKQSLSFCSLHLEGFKIQKDAQI